MTAKISPKTSPKTRTIIIVSLLALVSFTYYYLLSSKIWTWLYVTGDAGDWMMFTNWWIVPQPFGSPLFVSVIRLLGWVFPTTDVYQMLTLSLAVIPGTILVVLSYFIGAELTKNWKLGIVSALVLLGMSIPLTQATVLEEYMFTAVFVAGAFLAYIKNRITLAVALLGLGTASHAIVGVLAILWLAVERRHYKLIPLFILVGVLPYGLILYLMASDIPPLIAGKLSWGTLNLYMGNTYLTGNLSLVSIPQRLFDVAIVTVTMLGFAVYPLVVGLWKHRSAYSKIATVTILCLAWFWFSNTFFSTFKYMVMATPFIAGFVAVGLSRLPRWQTVAVAVGAVVLVAVNSVGLNADKLAHRSPVATDLYTAITNLPEGTAVLTPRGGAYGFVLFYAISEGHNLTPLLMKKLVAGKDGELVVDQGYLDYLDWFRVNYPEYRSSDSFTLAREALDSGKQVYFVSLFDYDTTGQALDVEQTGIDGLYKVTNVKVESWDAWIKWRLEQRLQEQSLIR